MILYVDKRRKTMQGIRFVNNNKYVTNIIPSGIFYNVMSIIGPDCVVNVESF